MSSAPAGRGTPRPSPSCARPATRPPTVPRRARPGGTQLRCGCSETMPPRRTGSSSSSRALGHSRPAATSRRATTPCSRATRTPPPMPSSCGSDSPPPAPGQSISSVATMRPHERLTAALADLDDPASPQAVALLLEIAVGRAYTMRYSRIADPAERALETARPLGDPPLIATAAAALASGLRTVRPCREGGEVPRGGGRAGRRALRPRPGREARLPPSTSPAPSSTWTGSQPPVTTLSASSPWLVPQANPPSSPSRS